MQRRRQYGNHPKENRMKTTTACDIAPLAAERPATTRTPLDAWLDSESRMSALILPLARKPATSARLRPS